ncbi:Asp/Glu racemase [Oceanimonas sp. GK1]|uniref:maleate cis-trans isomerase family protein n=1 Tax=Oceanimonas sp. (strain GK1 / IBRC-M 10197) TaxID=511062 RepID=UPI000249516E|nr:aspartate/glutamate racemase family protein [Oceanimonas sp. GK1]AEY01362.1 Asp/Glu racemase [Oceanimonas sp. GK1]
MGHDHDTFTALEQVYPFFNDVRRAQVRIGLVQLMSDYTLENDWHRLAGPGVEIYSTRMPYNSLMTPTSLKATGDHIADAAGLVAPGLPLDVMAFGCTSASMLLGNDAVAERLTRERPGLPTTNPWQASLSALRHLGIHRLAVLTPYNTEVNRPLYLALQQAGFEVVAFGAFALTLDTDIPAIHPDAIMEATTALLSGCDADGVFLSCTNLRALSVLEQLEQHINLPVVSSNQAMFWHALHLAGHPPQIPGFGRLLREPAAHPLVA